MFGRLNRLFDEVSETGPIPPREGRDWALAAVAAVAVVIEVLVEPDLRMLRLVIGLGTAALVPARRQHPFVSLALGLSMNVVMDAIARRSGLGGEATIGQIFAGILLVYTLCRWSEPKRVIAGLVVMVTTFIATEFLVEVGTNDISFVASWLVLGVLALAMRYRWVMVDQRDRRIRMAERHHLARDVHDSVAHHVSAIAVQAQAARYVASSDPDAALAAMARVEAAAGQTVDELRRLVGVLRADDPTIGAPAPESLIDLADADGRPPVRISELYDLTTVPASIATGVYRIAQEAITNARRHSRQATGVEVVLTRLGDQLVLEVTDDGATPGPLGTGYGLTSMRERAVVLGGRVTSGPLSKAGWRVRAVLPLR